MRMCVVRGDVVRDCVVRGVVVRVCVVRVCVRRRYVNCRTNMVALDRSIFQQRVQGLKQYHAVRLSHHRQRWSRSCCCPRAGEAAVDSSATGTTTTTISISTISFSTYHIVGLLVGVAVDIAVVVGGGYLY